MLKIGHHAKPIAHAKSSLWVKNSNSKKHVKIHSTNHLELFSAKSRSKKHQIFEKWDHVENRASSKAYSPCKILTLGQRIKILKNQSKSNLQIIYSCSVQKAAPKNTKYSTNETIFKIGHHAYPIAHAKSSLCVKNQKFQKTCQNQFYKSFTVVLCKKPLQKTLNIREMRPLSKSAMMQRL